MRAATAFKFASVAKFKPVMVLAVPSIETINEPEVTAFQVVIAWLAVDKLAPYN